MKSGKKVFFLYFPYVLLFALGAKLGQAWRLSPGTGFADKFLHIADGMGIAFDIMSPWFNIKDILFNIFTNNKPWTTFMINI